MPFAGTTTSVEKNKMIVVLYDRAWRVYAEQQQILTERQPSPERGRSRGISDELINELVRSSAMPIEDVRAIADWSIICSKDELKKGNIKFKSGTRKRELLKMMIHALALERRKTSRSLLLRYIGILLHWE